MPFQVPFSVQFPDCSNLMRRYSAFAARCNDHHRAPGIFAEHDDPWWPRHRYWRSRGRCSYRCREHLPPTADGQFQFKGLQPNVYKLTVTAPGMTTFISSDIPLRAGEFHILPPVTLAILPVTTSVTVSGNSKQLSEEQVHIAEQQRIVGVIPNFYSSYDWNAPPMLAKQKFQLSIRSIIDPVSFVSVAGIAGAEQYENVFPAYGGGIEGYGKRYGAAFANHLSATLLGRAVYPSIFHQDPRYFYKGKGVLKSRTLYAISAAVIARGDNGRWEPNYSRVLGHFTAAGISNLYYPASDRGGSLVLLNGLAGIGGDAVSNLIREFVLKRFTSHVPKGANGKP